MREMQLLVQKYVLNRERQMKYLAVLIALSLFVSFIVPFVLMQPADSMAEAATCGMEEHTHSLEEGCYQMVCVPEAEEEHEHTDFCYSLVCEKLVHTHTEECYPTKPDFSSLFSVIYDPNNMMAAAPGAGGETSPYANSPKDKPSEYKAPAGSILGVATHFHIFAESVSLQSHVHGNIATNWLLQNGAFGVYNDRLGGMTSINYIRNLGPNANLDNAYQTQLIMGSNYSSPPAPPFANRYAIRDKKTGKTYHIPKDKFGMKADGRPYNPQVKFEKPDRPYINITQELNNFANMSTELANKSASMSNNIIVPGHPLVSWDGQSEKITLDFSSVNDKYLYYTIDATLFGMNAPWSTWQKVLEIKGVTEDKFLFLTVDVGENEDAYFNKSWLVYKSDDQDNTYGTGEVTLEEGGTRVLYNIVNSTGTNGSKTYTAFDGKAVFGERRNGSILAPNADVNIAGNTNGTIIARNFVATGESHRCDAQIEGEERNDRDWDLKVEEAPTEAPTPPMPEVKKTLKLDVTKYWNPNVVPSTIGSIKVSLYRSKTPNLDVTTAFDSSQALETIELNAGNGWKNSFSAKDAYDGNDLWYYYIKEDTKVSNYTVSYSKNGVSWNTSGAAEQTVSVSVTNTEGKKISVTAKKVWNPGLEPLKKEQKTYKIMPVGDSITAGFGEINGFDNRGYRKYLDYILEQKGYSIDMVGPEGSEIASFYYNGQYVNFDNKHAGYGGYWIANDASDNLLAKLKEKNAIKNADPDIILLMIGTNNVNANQDPNNWEPELKRLLDYIVQNMRSDCMIFMGSIPDVKSGWVPSDKTPLFNSTVKSVVESYANSGWNIRFVDVNEWVNDDELFDSLHPNDTAYERMGKNWAEEVDKYLQEIQPDSSESSETKYDITSTVKLYKSKYGNLDLSKAEDFQKLTYVTSADLTSDNAWTYKFDNLYAMEGSDLLYYYIVEDPVPEYYTATYENNGVNSNNGTVVVTNTLEELLNINLDKIWVGVPEYQFQTPITVKLYSSTERNLNMAMTDAEFNAILGTKIHPVSDEMGSGKNYVTITPGKTESFTNLPVYDESGKMIYYYVREDAASQGLAGNCIPDYTHNPIYGGDQDVTITNTKKIKVSVTKEWQFNSTGTPQPVTVELYRYKYKPEEGKNFELPTFIPLGAEPVYITDANGNYILDANNQKQHYIQTIEGNNSVVFENLPIEEDGYKLFYYIREANANEFPDFKVIYGVQDKDNNPNDVSWQLVNPYTGATLNKLITNKEKEDTEISIYVKKNWDAHDYFVDKNENGELDFPEEFYVQDSVNPVEQWADPITVTLQYSTDQVHWDDYEGYKEVQFYDEYTFTGLPKTSNGLDNNEGTPYYYRVVEKYNYGYVTEYTGNLVDAKNVQKGDIPNIGLTNTLLKRTLSVKKNWYNGIDEGVDKVVVEIYRKTSKLQGSDLPDLGINKDNGTYTPGVPEEPAFIIRGMFENGSDSGWKLTGNHSNNDLTSSVASSTDWDAANDSGPGAYMVYINGLIEYKDPNDLSKLEAGKTYSFSAQVTRPYYAKLVVNFSDGTSTVILGKDQYGTNPGTAWADLSGEFVVPADKTVTSLQVGVDHEGGLYGDPLCIDDILVKETAAPTITYTEIFHDTFEENSNSWSGFGSTISTSGTTAQVGNNSLVVHSRTQTWNGVIRDLDENVFIPGNTYSFSAYVQYRADGDNAAAESNQINMTLRYKDATGEQRSVPITSTIVNGADNWQKLENLSYPIPEGATDLQLLFDINTSLDKFYIDEVIACSLSTNSGNTGGGNITPPDEPSIDPTKPVNSFDDGTTQGWNAQGTLSYNGTNGGLQTDVTYDNSAYSYGLLSQNGTANGEAFKDGETPYYYCAYIEKEYTNLTAGSIFTFNAKVARNSTAQVYAALRVVCENGEVYVVRTQTSATSGNWVTLSGRFLVPQNAGRVKLQIVPITDSGNMSTMMYVDDIKVELESNSGTPSTSRLPSTFENGSTDGWTLVSNEKHSQGTLISEVVTTNKSDGPGAYQLWYHGTLEFSDQSILSQFTSGNTYELSMQCNRVKVSKMVVYFSGGNSVTFDGTSTNLDGSWQEFSGEFTVPQNERVSRIQVGVDKEDTTHGLSGSRMLVDDINITLVSSGDGNQGGGNENQGTALHSTNFDNGEMNGWTANGMNGSVDLSNKYCELDFSNKWNNDTYPWMQFSIPSSFEFGKTYMFNAIVSRGDSGTANVTLKVSNDYGTTKVDVKTVEVGNGWTTLNGQFTVENAHGGTQLFVYTDDNTGILRIDDITITPVPSGQSKPRTAETFFTNRSMLTKSTLNIQKMSSDKLAKGTPNTVKWVDVAIDITDSSNSERQGLVNFSGDFYSYLQDVPLRHIEVEFTEPISNYGATVNVYFNGGTGNGKGNWTQGNSDNIYSFGRSSEYIITSTSSLVIETKYPNKIKRLSVVGTNGSVLVVNNITAYTHELPYNSHANNAQSIEYTLTNQSQSGSYQQLWGVINSANNEVLNKNWSGQKISHIDVIFDKDYANSGTLQNDWNNIKSSHANATVSQFGMYLLQTQVTTSTDENGETVTSSGWEELDGTALTVSNVGDYVVAHYDYLNDSKQDTIADGLQHEVILKASDPTKIKAIVIRSSTGDAYTLYNDAYVNDDRINARKMYPFQNSDSSNIDNLILSVDELGKEFNGKTIASIDAYFKDGLYEEGENVSANAAKYQLWLQDFTVKKVNSDGTTSSYTGNLLNYTTLPNVGSSGVVDNKGGSLDMAHYVLNMNTYEAYGTTVASDTNFVANYAKSGNNWNGDRINIFTKSNADLYQVVVNFSDGSTYTIGNMNYVPDKELHNGHETSFVQNGTTNLLNNVDTYQGYSGKQLDYIIVSYGEDDDEFISIPRDMISLDGTQGKPSIEGGVAMKHTYTGVKNVDVLKIIEDASDDFSLADIKEIKLQYKDSFKSTYTITNTDYSPKAEAAPPVAGNQPVLDGSYVFISTLELVKNKDGVWEADLSGLPVTDGQGNLYEYLVVEKSVYGEGADRYQLISYEHPDGLPLDDDKNNDKISTSLMNSSIDDENGPIFMPSTGGEGRTWFYVGGIALMLCSIAGCYGMKRWQKSRR